jgi:hypothetical protein
MMMMMILSQRTCLGNPSVCWPPLLFEKILIPLMQGYYSKNKKEHYCNKREGKERKVEAGVEVCPQSL